MRCFLTNLRINNCIYIFLFLSVGFVTTPSISQEIEPTVIAVADVQRLLRESKAGVSIEEQLSELRTVLTDAVGEREQTLRQQEEDLQDQMAVLAPEVFTERRRVFEEEVIAFQREVRERQRALDEVYGEGLNQIRLVIIEVLQQMVEDRGYDLILPQSQILVGSRDLDITEDVLTELNERLPTITINLDEN